MSLLAATVAAFTAAYVEGHSVINHAQKNGTRTPSSSSTSSDINESDEQVGNIVIPSLVYSVVALPLSIIGSSPSLELISKIAPLSPSLVDNEGKGNKRDARFLEEAVPAYTTTTTGSLHNHPRRRRMKLGTSTKSTSKVYNDIHDEKIHFNEETNESDRKILKVKKVRHDNRQTLTSASAPIMQERITQLPLQSARMHIQNVSASSSSLLSYYVATLDGRSLSTPLAESMRRFRILAFTFGVISISITTSSYQSKEKTAHVGNKKGRNWHLPRQTQVQEFIEQYKNINSETKSKEGVVMRLCHNQNELDRLSNDIKINHELRTESSLPSSLSPPKYQSCILPIATTSTAFDTIKNDDNQNLYWSLGQKESEWNELPISTKWLFGQRNKDDELNQTSNSLGFILVESNLWSSLHESIIDFSQRKQSSNANEKKIQNDLLESRKIQHVALSKLVNSSREEKKHLIGLYNVFIGDGGNYLSSPNKEEMFIDGLDAIASCIREEVITMHYKEKKLTTESIINNCSNSTDLEEASDIRIRTSPIDLIDRLGKCMRQTGQGFAQLIGILKGKQTIESIQNSKSNNNDLEEAPDTKIRTSPIDLIDGLGKRIRQNGQIFVNLIGESIISKIHGRNQNSTVVHIISDRPEIISWLETLLKSEKGIRLIICNTTTNNINSHIQKYASDDERFLILCSSDPATINVASQAIKNATSKGIKRLKCISTLENTTSATTLHSVIRPFLSNENLQNISLCVDSIHEKSFALARRKLVER
jgi:hypothetical protein